jgi:hypothetical protein
MREVHRGGEPNLANIMQLRVSEKVARIDRMNRKAG